VIAVLTNTASHTVKSKDEHQKEVDELNKIEKERGKEAQLADLSSKKMNALKR
jgi:hypothetical protein